MLVNGNSSPINGQHVPTRQMLVHYHRNVEFNPIKVYRYRIIKTHGKTLPNVQHNSVYACELGCLSEVLLDASAEEVVNHLHPTKQANDDTSDKYEDAARETGSCPQCQARDRMTRTHRWLIAHGETAFLRV